MSDCTRIREELASGAARSAEVEAHLAAVRRAPLLRAMSSGCEGVRPSCRAHRCRRFVTSLCRGPGGVPRWLARSPSRRFSSSGGG